MPRANKRGGRGAARNALLGTRGGLQTVRSRPTGDGEQISFSGFTLQDEARNTGHAQTPWSQDARLRHRPVSFISGGAIDPLKQQEQLPRQSEDLGDSADQISEASPLDTAAATLGIKATEAETTRSQVDEEPPDSIILPPPSPLPYFLDVTGAKSPKKDAVPPTKPMRSPSPCRSDSSEEVILFKGRKHGGKVQQAPFNFQEIRNEIHVVGETIISDDLGPTASDEAELERGQYRSLGSRRGSRRKRRPPERNRDDEDDILADYISNMRAHADDHGLLPALSYADRDLGGTETPPDSSEESCDDAHEIMSTSKAAETIHNTESGSEAPSDEPQEGQPLSEPPTPNELDTAIPFEDQEPLPLSGLVDDLLLATLLDDEPTIGSADQLSRATSAHLGDAAAGRAIQRTGHQDNFDFMDWDRPSLQRRGKGARSQPVFDVSDSELESQMQAAWNNDRLKKAERKKLRNELRSKGLVGKNADPSDLRVRFPSGMSLAQIADVLRDFLLGTEPSLALPPMDAHARKIIHEICSKFNIKSKSTGKGEQRQPVLHRNLRTMKYAQETFDLAIGRVGRKYFPRLDVKVTSIRRAAAIRGPSQGSGHAATSYRDGEVVGASAPELSLQNKGRTMLEKMGWSSGTALGAENNKGILQPVTHVVKRSKAGLG